MQKTFTCEVHATNGQVFEISYQSTQHKDDKPFNVIREVKLCDYILSLGQLRERSIWVELVDAVDNNSYHAWEEYWKQKPLNTDNIHPVFADIFDTLANAINPNTAQNQLDNIENISQQGAEC